jgi:hypothetical protein
MATPVPRSPLLSWSSTRQSSGSASASWKVIITRMGTSTRRLLATSPSSVNRFSELEYRAASLCNGDVNQAPGRPRPLPRLPRQPCLVWQAMSSITGNIVAPFGLFATGSVQKLVGSRGDCDSCIWTADGFESLIEAGTKRPVVNCAADLQHQVSASPRPAHPLGLVHPAIDQEIRRALCDRSPDPVSSGIVLQAGRSGYGDICRSREVCVGCFPERQRATPARHHISPDVEV